MLFSRVRRWVTESLRSQSQRTSRRAKWASLATQGLEQRLLLAGFSEFVDPNPAAGNGFGTHVVPLSTGNVVITSPYDDAGGTDAGAVYLFNGATGALISTLIGSHANDNVGYGGVTALTNGNYVVSSYAWDNGAATDAGAVTWGSGTVGIAGIVSASNSLVGSKNYDQVGSRGVTALTNGNYVVLSAGWDNEAATDAGAVTWGSGTVGIVGIVSASNSLVGSTANNQVGYGGITALTNGNYVVSSSYWDNGAATDAGAVTWGNGTVGIVGIVSASNSLVGSKTNDSVGSIGITALTNGNYVVSSSYWDNGAVTNVGAVTWGNGTTGIAGTVSASNSLVGSKTNDTVGGNGITALTNGNYVVNNYYWDNGAVADAGAVTWGSGTTGVQGIISASNSLVGSTASDLVGEGGITVLTNGNYVVRSSSWDNGAAADAGAVTWGNGTTGIAGIVSASNSLVGSTAYNYVGSSGITALTNGNYVVSSSVWDNGAATRAGAVTWGNGTTGVKGIVSASNSLVGSTVSDRVGSSGITALTNGNYVVRSSLWDNGAATDAGAVTWGSGAAGIVGIVSASNSLVGSTASDNVGAGGITALTSGNYVVRSINWDNGVVPDAGAVTWGSGTTGVKGIVSASNSLVGSTVSDRVGEGGIIALTNGNYVVRSYNWDNGAATNAGAVTWGSGTTGVKGIVSASNSLVGSAANNFVGLGGITALTNGNYVVSSYYWDNGAVTNVGAVTWGNGTTGIAGTVSASNSSVGSKAFDQVGLNGITALTNGNYIAYSYEWDNGAVPNVGAVTWGSGTAGGSGVVTSINSLVGGVANANLQFPAVLDNVNNQYYARFLSEGGGRVRVGSQLGHAPTDISLSSSLIAENSSNGTIVGGLSVSDVDLGDTFIYSLLNNAGGRFGISGSNLVVADGTLLDRETNTSHSVTVRVTDANGLTFDKVFVITVTNVNEPPVISAPVPTVNLNENLANGTVVATVLAGDVDAGDVLTYSITAGNESGAFAIDGSGVITVADRTQLDFETTPTFTLTVRVADSLDQSATATVTVNLVDQVEYRFLNGTLSVYGTGLADAITVRSVLGLIQIDANLAMISTGVRTTTVTQIEVYGADGNDALTIDTSVYSSIKAALFGEGGDDTLIGGQGSDRLEGGTGQNTLDGRGGEDAASYSLATAGVVVDLSLTDFQPTLGAGIDKLSNIEGLIGSAFSDVLTGNNAANKLQGLAGDDQLFGMGGDDFLIGGEGADELFGGDQNDSLLFDELDTNVIGGAGTDLARVYQSAGGVTLNLTNGLIEIADAPGSTVGHVFDATGATWSVTITGGEGNDTLIGGDMADKLLGRGGDDSLIGHGGNDALYGESGADAIDGGEGSDILMFDELDTNVIGGAGTDLARVYQSAGGVTLNLTNGQIESVTATSSTFDNLFDATGATWAVTVTGGSGNDTIIGGDLNDNLIGGAGNDSLVGNDGHDALMGGLGADAIDGGEGNDALTIDNLDTSVIGGAGLDRVTVAGATGGVTLNLTSGQIETVAATSSTFDNLFDATGATWAVTVTGGTGNDTVIGGDLNDILSGGAGNDSLVGTGGNDTLTGGLGADRFDGGEGNDALTIDNLDTSVIGGAGLDRVTVAGATGGVTLNLTSGQIETVAATSSTFDNLFDATGATWAVTVTGGTGNDTVIGGDLNDNLNGGAGNDSLVGTGGNDTLTGGLGADRFDGGEGNDALTIDNLDTSVIGGAGLDRVTMSGATGGVTLNLTSGQIETVIASASTYSNVFDATGATWAVNITGGSGADLLIGGNLNDTLNGGAGNDTLIGNLGNDLLTGGNDTDTISYKTASGPVTVNLSTKKATGAAGIDTLSGIENVIGSPYNDTIFGDLLNNLLDGGDGILNNDTILGGGGIDSIINA
ncbi:MAG: cadherin domain-containing protein [Planctomycetaceae bacterium]